MKHHERLPGPQEQEPEIKRAGPQDGYLFERVADDVFDAPIEASALLEFLSARDHLMVIGFADSQVVAQARGIIHLSPDEGPQLYIDNLGVTPSRQRRGLGARLVEELFAWGRERGCTGAWVATENDNGNAISLYERLGARRQDMVYFEYPLS